VLKGIYFLKRLRPSGCTFEEGWNIHLLCRELMVPSSLQMPSPYGETSGNSFKY